MLTLRSNVVKLYVDRASQHWIVLDAEGSYWLMSTEHTNPWERRQPFYPTEETELEPIPSHYGYLLGLST